MLSYYHSNIVTWRVLEGNLARGTERGKFSPKLGLVAACRLKEMALVQNVHGAVEDVVGRSEALMQLQRNDNIKEYSG